MTEAAHPPAGRDPEVVLRRSPLDPVHRALGAKMVPFGGWEMPLAYADGTIAEHLRCRRDAVMFDVSHLGTVRVSGLGGFDAIQWAFTNDLRKIGPGRAQYTHLLDPKDASVVDDLIVWWHVAAEGPAGDHVFDVMPNASNTTRVQEALRLAADHARHVRVEDTTADRAVLAVQGPHARSAIASLSPEAAGVRRFAVTETDVAGVACVVAGTGYTGEDGVEIAVPRAEAEHVWTAITQAGIAPAGLGARDTLRLEAALPLHGHELGPGITTREAGLGWVLGVEKADYRGRDAVERERVAGIARRLVGIALAGRQPARDGAAVLRGGERVGTVTSGNYAPSVGRAIALALVAPSVAVGDDVALDVRGRLLDGRVVATPFVAPPPGR